MKFGAGLSILALAACGPATRSSGAATANAPFVVERIRDEPDARLEHGLDAGPPTLPQNWAARLDVTLSRTDDAATPLAAIERAWLVAHIGDQPDGMHTGETPNVRALAAMGADGVRAVAPILARADGERVPYVRRVIERNATRACREYSALYSHRLIAWLELGRIPAEVSGDRGPVQWFRGASEAWPTEAIRRLEQWANAGLPCFQSREAASDAGSAGDAGATGGAGAASGAADAT